MTTEVCNNGVDDDGDTLVDLADPDCATQIATSLSAGEQSGTEITVDSGTAVHDTATLSGNSVATAGGTVTYAVYSDAACTVLEASAGTKSVVNGVVGDSDALRSRPAPGTGRRPTAATRRTRPRQCATRS